MKNVIKMICIISALLILNPNQVLGQFFFLENPNIGTEAENFKLPTFESGEVSLNDIRGEKRAFVFFWATWCPHCREALSEIQERKKEIQDLNIKIVLVDVGETKQVVSSYMKKNNINMNVFLDEASKAAELYGVIGIPTFYFIGEDGVIRNVKNALPQDLDDVFYGT